MESVKDILKTAWGKVSPWQYEIGTAIGGLNLIMGITTGSIIQILGGALLTVIEGYDLYKKYTG